MMKMTISRDKSSFNSIKGNWHQPWLNHHKEEMMISNPKFHKWAKLLQSNREVWAMLGSKCYFKQDPICHNKKAYQSNRVKFPNKRVLSATKLAVFINSKLISSQWSHTVCPPLELPQQPGKDLLISRDN